eukprot:TRINITY_DN4361_c0_g6_i1.p1 TRINITY_DN4361_c0_g6~~TRINITY_DN4361_c0_g6_i1.p1  ORF type:complete len:189 (-),score=65.19 TRINITY_DN4361_c0_g6_i1:5-511(-)
MKSGAFASLFISSLVFFLVLNFHHAELSSSLPNDVEEEESIEVPNENDDSNDHAIGMNGNRYDEDDDDDIEGKSGKSKTNKRRGIKGQDVEEVPDENDEIYSPFSKTWEELQQLDQKSQRLEKNLRLTHLAQKENKVELAKKRGGVDKLRKAEKDLQEMFTQVPRTLR